MYACGSNFMIIVYLIIDDAFRPLHCYICIKKNFKESVISLTITFILE